VSPKWANAILPSNILERKKNKINFEANEQNTNIFAKSKSRRNQRESHNKSKWTKERECSDKCNEMCLVAHAPKLAIECFEK
jgi:hypothetical protein